MGIVWVFKILMHIIKDSLKNKTRYKNKVKKNAFSNFKSRKC